jgi:prevent-host-death family protein
VVKEQSYKVTKEDIAKKSASMSKVISVQTAQEEFGQIVKRVRNKNERFVIDRRGEPQAIIMSLADYIDAIAPEPDWLKKIREGSKRRGTNKLTMRQIDGIIADTRRKGRAKRIR